MIGSAIRLRHGARMENRENETLQGAVNRDEDVTSSENLTIQLEELTGVSGFLRTMILLE